MRRYLHWIFSNNRRTGLVGALLIAGFIGSGLMLWSISAWLSPGGADFLDWWRGDAQTRADLITVQRDACPNAPFILPADGFIGLLYADPRGPYSRSKPHQGIDIFSNAGPGVIPVYTAYDGYLTREKDWKSTVIQRLPEDPLNPEQQIWLYYTHMADEDGNDFIVDTFEPGLREYFVEQGTLLGYTGNYNGNSLRDVWVHLHFSIVKDVNGRYANELEFENTIDPSPYLGLRVNYSCADISPGCIEEPTCR